MFVVVGGAKERFDGGSEDVEGFVVHGDDGGVVELGGAREFAWFGGDEAEIFDVAGVIEAGRLGAVNESVASGGILELGESVRPIDVHGALHGVAAIDGAVGHAGGFYEHGDNDEKEVDRGARGADDREDDKEDDSTESEGGWDDFEEAVERFAFAGRDFEAHDGNLPNPGETEKACHSDDCDNEEHKGDS